MTERKLLLPQTVGFASNGSSVDGVSDQEFRTSDVSLERLVTSLHKGRTEKIADAIKTATGAAASETAARPTQSVLAGKCMAVNLTGDDLRLVFPKWREAKSAA